jgi:hypothetical protein
MTRRWLLLILVLVIVGVFLEPAVAVRREMGWVDALTGSTRHQTHWVFGFKGRAVVEPSALERWIVDRQGSHEHDWRNVQGTSKTLLGRSIGFSHGPAPPIYPLCGRMMDAFVCKATDDEIAEFVRVMRIGTEAEQEAAVDAAFERMTTTTDRDG